MENPKFNKRKSKQIKLCNNCKTIHDVNYQCANKKTTSNQISNDNSGKNKNPASKRTSKNFSNKTEFSNKNTVITPKKSNEINKKKESTNINKKTDDKTIIKLEEMKETSKNITSNNTK